MASSDTTTYIIQDTHYPAKLIIVLTKLTRNSDLAEDLVVEGETYGCVKSFCYLGDTLDRDGGTDISATVRIINEWMKFMILTTDQLVRYP